MYVDRMLLVQWLSAWRKWLMVVAIYSVLCLFAYELWWKDNGPTPVPMPRSMHGPLRNQEQYFYTSGGIDVESLINESTDSVFVIAIGAGITSRLLHNVSEDNIRDKFQFFYAFMPTFCRTASRRFRYKFYLAYDHVDEVFSRERLRDAFQRQFRHETTFGSCRQRDIAADLTLVECAHQRKPAWAQNDAMLEAYLDHVDYLYRINDDTRLLTDGWTEKFITTLDSYDPSRVGVVGPNSPDDNLTILTYEFVHRTHVDIFGFYYPRLFTDWQADRWITYVYEPYRSTKMADVRLAHTKDLGRRYDVSSTVKRRREHGNQLVHDVAIVKRYVEAIENNDKSGVRPDERKIISMSLYGSDPRYTWGALRNAQLLPVYLPDWTLRVYVADEQAPGSELVVPPRIINKLRLLGAEVATVPTGNSMAPRNWRLLAADDQTVDYFLVRDADARLSEREASAVRDWLSAAEKNGSQSAVVHCIRDHPEHADHAIVDGLWGGRPKALHQKLSRNLTDILGSRSARSEAVEVVFNEFLWQAVSDVAYCHDSVSPYDRWTPAASRRSFPTARQAQQFLGQKFDEHQEPVSKDGVQTEPDVVCSPVV